jgi:HTH-type transcriptional regulator/antitoxin HigA
LTTGQSTGIAFHTFALFLLEIIMTDTPQGFSPDWVSPPGESIADLVEERGWTQAELAERLGYTPKHLNQLIKGKVPLSEDAALRLERVLGGSAAFWLSREARYRERLARLDAQARLGQWTDWLDELPVKALMTSGAIPKRRIDAKARPALVETLLHFFGVASPKDWRARYGGMQVSFRRSRADQSDLGAISAWLRMGERLAEREQATKYDRQRLLDAIPLMRALTVQPPEVFEPTLRRLCIDSGVTLVLVPAIPGAHVSGVARWLNANRPMIQLSLYGKSNDRFWFTLFHEAAHLLLHAQEKKAVFLDDPDHADMDSDQEREANAWAADILIPEAHRNALAALQTKDAVRTFASQIGIHPGIVVGRLQHQRIILPSWMNDLKVSLQFREGSEASESGAQ